MVDLILLNHPELISDFTLAEMQILNDRISKVIVNIRRSRNKKTKKFFVDGTEP